MFKYALLLMLLAPFTARADCAHNWMQCPVSSSLQINSFGLQAKYVIQSITVARIKATRGLQKHMITSTQAKVVLAETDLGRKLWNSAVAACHIDEHGNCDTPEDSRKAFALLNLARNEGAAWPVYRLGAGEMK
jgi:hypothetical protein